MTIDVNLQGALTSQNIRIDTPSTFTVAISTKPDVMPNAASRLLGMQAKEIEVNCLDIILGQLRQTIAELSIEEINSDRDKFLQLIQGNVSSEINKIGLELINVNIKDLSDESGYIIAIGQKAAATAIQQANVDVAEQNKHGAIGVAEATKAQQVSVAEAKSLESIGVAAATKDQEVGVAEAQSKEAQGRKAAEAEQRIYVKQKEAEAVQGETLSQGDIAKANSVLEITRFEAKRDADVSNQETTVTVQEAAALAEKARLNTVTIVPSQVAKEQAIIHAEAKAKEITIAATGDANAIFAVAEAEAKGVEAMLTAKAEGFGQLVERAGGPEYAVQLLITEQLTDIAKIQVEAISNLEIDKLVVWENGSEGGGLKGLMNGMMGSLPAIHDLAAASNLELPEFMGKSTKDSRVINKLENDTEQPQAA